MKINQIKARELLNSFSSRDQELISFFEDNSLNDGSVDISKINLNSDFLKMDGVCSREDGTVTTRGYNYICSLDVSLTSIQKIKKYIETVYLSAEALKNNNLSKLEKIILLDYLKNSLVTIFNSFIYQEKLGLKNKDQSKDYEEIRSELITNIESVIRCSVDFILDKDLDSVSSIGVENILSTTNKALNKFKEYYRSYKLPSFYVSRPEVTHPLTIISASLVCAKKYKKIDIIVGVPSGGTEFAFTTKVLMDKIRGEGVNLVFLPISFHSLKKFSTEDSNEESIKINIGKYFSENANSALICDDNASTGKTLQLLKNSIKEMHPEIKIYCAVAEADIIRSVIDRDNKKRTHIVNKDIYADSVNILPVSRRISPKVDLKELIENRKIINYYKNMAEKSNELVDQIYAKVMIHVNKLGIDYSIFTEENSIRSFRGTFLSNFYAVPVELNRKKYPSVEHAYQATKFQNVDWNSIPQEAKEEILEALKIRGFAAPLIYDRELFADPKLGSGNAKIIADILHKYNLGDKDWEEKRIKIMINLLIQKFKNKKLLLSLKETCNKELIEGNTWNDTLWGVCDGSGRNILGVTLMEIRQTVN